MRLFLSLSLVCLCFWNGIPLHAATPPSETVFPATTKGWISVPNVDSLREHFSQTQLGELIKDPAMSKFMEDLHTQLREKLNNTGVRLGISLEDLEGVYAGELALGLIQPNPKDINSHCLAMLVDVTGKDAAAQALLAKIEQNLIAKGAVKSNKKAGEIIITHFTLPLKPEQKIAEHVNFVIHAETLLVADQTEVIVAMLDRLGAEKKTDDLEDLIAFLEVFNRVQQKAGEINPHTRWFIEPMGFAETNRAANGGKKKKGTDPITVLRKQGFGEIKGLGGNINFATEQHETLHRTYIYAPLSKPGEKKLSAAAGILDFPNTKNLEVQPWVPHGVSTYLTFNVRMAQSFEHFGPLFDGFTEEGTFDEILSGLAEDPAGPQIDIRKEIIAMLGERISLLTDYHLPVDTRCERLLVALELKQGEEAAAAAIEAIRKLMKAEPNANRVEVEGFEAWEIVERIEEAEVPTLDIGGPGFVAFEPGVAVAHAAPANPPGIVVAVAKGHIFVGSHLDFLAEVLKERAAGAQLGASKDFQIVTEELKKLGSAEDSFRFFTRTDEAYRPTYELLQQGKLPVAETLLARSLNRILTSDKKGAVRKAVIDGKNMPPFGAIRHYFGPGGFYTHTDSQGWFITGCLLKKPDEEIAKKPD